MHIRLRHVALFVVMVASLSLSMALIPRMVRRTFAVEALAVGIYWDQAATRKVVAIDWGELTPGSTKEVTLFLKNEELTHSCFMFLMIQGWSPSEAARYMSLTWNYANRHVNPGATIQVTLTLKVAQTIRVITNFDFTIVIRATEYLVGDVDHDDMVDIFDTVLLGQAYQTTPLDALWNPDADFNADDRVNIYDVQMLLLNFGASAIASRPPSASARIQRPPRDAPERTSRRTGWVAWPI